METAYKLQDNGEFVTINGTTKPRRFYATDFANDARPEKGRFVCSCCHEAVKWMPHGLNEGGFKSRKAHWAAVKRPAHEAKGCTAISTDEYDESLSAKCTENQAIQNRAMTILIRLNFSTRHGLKAMNQKEMTYERLWCRKHKGQYKPKVIHDMDELAEFLNKLVQTAPEGQFVTDRVMVSHGGTTRALSEFLLLSPEKRRAQYDAMDNRKWQRRHNGKLFKTSGFPCVIPFQLDYSEKNNVGDLRRVFNAASRHDRIAEVFRTPDYMDSADLIGKTGYVIAWPYLNRENPGKLMWSIHDINHITTQKIDMQPRPTKAPFKHAAE